MRIGLLGGTFDPVHNAHLRLALVAAEECRLDQVLLVPAAHPPHRVHGTFASYEDRFRMVEIACEPYPLLNASRLDNTQAPSYSLETATRLRSTLPPDAEIFFLIGADAFAELKTWYRWSELALVVRFAVVDRPGATYPEPAGVRITRVTGVDLPVSSSGIRAELAAGRFDVAVPEGVLRYIREHRLYGV